MLNPTSIVIPEARTVVIRIARVARQALRGGSRSGKGMLQERFAEVQSKGSARDWANARARAAVSREIDIDSNALGTKVMRFSERRHPPQTNTAQFHDTASRDRLAPFKFRFLAQVNSHRQLCQARELLSNALGAVATKCNETPLYKVTLAATN